MASMEYTKTLLFKMVHGHDKSAKTHRQVQAFFHTTVTVLMSWISVCNHKHVNLNSFRVVNYATANHVLQRSFSSIRLTVCLRDIATGHMTEGRLMPFIPDLC